MLTHGGAAEYTDERVFESVERLLRRASQNQATRARCCCPSSWATPAQWRLRRICASQPSARWRGPFSSVLKRRVLLPLNRWLYEFVLGNFHRQQRLNLVLISCVEELAIENARLRRDLQRLKGEP